MAIHVMMEVHANQSCDAASEVNASVVMVVILAKHIHVMTRGAIVKMFHGVVIVLMHKWIVKISDLA
jgi:hypothetical protein